MLTNIRALLGNKLLVTILIGVVILVTGYRVFEFVTTYGCILIHGDRWQTMEPLFFYSTDWWRGFAFQHGPHRLGLIHFLFRADAYLSNWNSKVDLYVQAGIYVITVIVALRLKTKLYHKLNLADVIIPLILLTPHAASTLFSNPFVHGIVPLFAIGLCFIYFIQSEKRTLHT